MLAAIEESLRFERERASVKTPELQVQLLSSPEELAGLAGQCDELALAIGGLNQQIFAKQLTTRRGVRPNQGDSMPGAMTKRSTYRPELKRVVTAVHAAKRVHGSIPQALSSSSVANGGRDTVLGSIVAASLTAGLHRGGVVRCDRAGKQVHL